MKNVLWGLLAVIFVGVAVFLGARLLTSEDNWICQNGTWVKHGNPSGPMPTGSCKEGEQIAPKKVPTEAAIANPAAKNCLDKGGKLATLKETAGELSICKFTDGSECEEWQFYREECKKGQYLKADTSHSYNGLIRKVGKNYVFKDNSGVEYSLKLPDKADSELTERLSKEADGRSSVVIVALENPPLSKILVLKNFVEK